MDDFLHEVDAHQLRMMAYRAAVEEVRQARIAAMLTRSRSQQLRSHAKVVRDVARASVGTTLHR